MKVILSGPTGYIGSSTLTHLLSNPQITTLLLLTRREIPPSSIPSPLPTKLKILLIPDFTSYDPTVIQDLQSADAAIWCLGTSTGDERIDIEFPLYFLDVIRQRKREEGQGQKPFRYVQLSGAFTELPPPTGQEPRALWFFTNGRRVRGAMEAKILEVGKRSSTESGLEVYLVKPGGVLSGYFGSILQSWVFGDRLSVAMDQLGTVMVDLAVRGGEKKVFSNQEIIRYARALREKGASI